MSHRVVIGNSQSSKFFLINGDEYKGVIKKWLHYNVSLLYPTGKKGTFKVNTELEAARYFDLFGILCRGLSAMTNFEYTA